jgi:hypothetical protein
MPESSLANFGMGQGFLFTSNYAYQCYSAYVSPNSFAGESGVNVDFNTTGSAKLTLTLRNDIAVRELIAALQAAIAQPLDQTRSPGRT